eukprot:CAMPEP_0168353948 /NCGR_PEP_ID=MMETSP0213-20121227/23576_1 /TAXON_ID=151035 /ORGANISM="Euplotes harpa, Strain FSP1.4" /LENGTH=534 /DNA_ID=CAMNT_0008365699 /DNA_START=1045 /DNA_END=2649 /DNA_ORIENTATION=+
MIWGLGIPIYAIKIMHQNKANLDSQKVKNELGYLYNGYTYKAYYWEEYIMIRKMMITSVSTFLATKGKIYQTLVVLMMLALFLALQALMKPFHSANFNRLELFSLLASFMTIFAGYFFLSGVSSGEESSASNNDFVLLEEYKIVFFIVILAFQCLFFLTWFFQLHYEVKRFVEQKSRKAYNMIYLCNKLDKIEKAEAERLKRNYEEARDQVFESLIDNYDYLLELRLSGKMHNTNEFDFFVTQSLNKLRSFDMRDVSELKDENMTTRRPVRKDNKVVPIKNSVDLSVEFDMSMDALGKKKVPMKIPTSVGTKPKSQEVKDILFQGFFRPKKRKPKTIREKLDTSANDALERYLNQLRPHAMKQPIKEENYEYSEFSDGDERREKVLGLVQFIRDIGIKSLQNKRSLQKSNKETSPSTPVGKRFFNDENLNSMIEEEKIDPNFNNGLGISFINNNQAKVESKPQEQKSADESAIDLNATISPMDFELDKNEEGKSKPRGAVNNYFSKDKSEITDDEIAPGMYAPAHHYDMDEEEY